MVNPLLLLQIIRNRWTKYLILGSLSVMVLSCWGIILAFLFSALAYVPSYRRWLRDQPGYVHYLARLPGLHNTNTLKLSCATFAYLFPVSLLFTWLVWSSTSRIDEIIGDLVLSVIGMIILCTWFIGKWGFKDSSLLAPTGKSVKTTAWRKSLERVDLDFADYKVQERIRSSKSLLGIYNAPLWKRLLDWCYYIWYNQPVLKIVSWSFLLAVIPWAMIFYGVILLPVGCVLAFMPGYRYWLVRQPGYLRRLAKLPGLRPATLSTGITPLRLVLATFLYLLPTFCFSCLNFWGIIGIYDTALLLTYLAQAAASSLGLVALYGWCFRNWHFGILDSIGSTEVLRTLLHSLSSKRKHFEQLYAQVHQNYQQAPAQMIPLAIELRNMALQSFGEDSTQYALSINMLGLVYKHAADYTTAELYFQQAHELLVLAKGTNHPDYAICLSNLGALYSLKSDYVAAEALFQRALAIECRTLGWKNRYLAINLNDLGQLYIKMGNYELAQLLFKTALDIYRRTTGEQHPQYARGLDALATLLVTEGNLDEALRFFVYAQDVRQRHLGSGDPDFATSLSNVASVYQRKGDYATAESLYSQARDIRRQCLGESHPGFAASLRDLAQVYSRQGKYSHAEPLLHQALFIVRGALGEKHPTAGAYLADLADLRAAQGHAEEALDKMRQVIDIDQQMIGQAFSLGSEDQRMQFLTTLRKNTNLYFSLLLQNSLSSSTVPSMGLELALRRKALGATALAVQRDTLLAKGNPVAQAKAQELRTLSRRISQRILDGPGSEGWRVYERELKDWDDRKHSLEKELAHQIQPVNFTWQLAAMGQKTIARALPSGTALIEFVCFEAFDFKHGGRWMPARYLAFVLYAGAADRVQMIDLGEAREINARIAALRKAIADEDQRREHPDAWKSLGADVRKAVFDPLLPALGGRTFLFVAPDGDLSLLPFEVLSIENDRCLIDDYHICYLSVGRDVLNFKHRETTQFKTPLIIADPDFDFCTDQPRGQKDLPQPGERRSRDMGENRGGYPFGRLAKTEEEGRRVAELLAETPAPVLLFREAALKTRLIRCDSPYILHIATHGFFLPNQIYHSDQEQPALAIQASSDGTTIQDRIARLTTLHTENPLLRSGLILAGANTWNQRRKLPPEAGNGIVTADEVSELNLLNTELAVLSACETGLGEIRTGEGVFGLRRAFMLAGAETVVMSLWQVPDFSTMRIMIDFYARIKAGQPCAEALRAAQLARREKKPHPYYWGGFICQGDPRPLSKYQRAARC